MNATYMSNNWKFPLQCDSNACGSWPCKQMSKPIQTWHVCMCGQNEYHESLWVENNHPYVKPNHVQKQWLNCATTVQRTKQVMDQTTMSVQTSMNTSNYVYHQILTSIHQHISSSWAPKCKDPSATDITEWPRVSHLQGSYMYKTHKMLLAWYALQKCTYKVSEALFIYHPLACQWPALIAH